MDVQSKQRNQGVCPYGAICIQKCNRMDHFKRRSQGISKSRSS
jgi:hypothetical protein